MVGLVRERVRVTIASPVFHVPPSTNLLRYPFDRHCNRIDFLYTAPPHSCTLALQSAHRSLFSRAWKGDCPDVPVSEAYGGESAGADARKDCVGHTDETHQGAQNFYSTLTHFLQRRNDFPPSGGYTLLRVRVRHTTTGLATALARATFASPAHHEDGSSSCRVPRTQGGGNQMFP